jgi:hypothetical protein
MVGGPEYSPQRPSQSWRSEKGVDLGQGLGDAI